MGTTTSALIAVITGKLKVQLSYRTCLLPPALTCAAQSRLKNLEAAHTRPCLWRASKVPSRHSAKEAPCSSVYSMDLGLVGWIHPADFRSSNSNEEAVSRCGLRNLVGPVVFWCCLLAHLAFRKQIDNGNQLHYLQVFQLVSTGPGAYYVHNDLLRLIYS